jgi:hypothetical protein
MYGQVGVTRITTSANLSTSPCRVFTIHLVPKTDWCFCNVRELEANGSQGNIYINHSAAATGGSTVNFQEGIYFPYGCYVETMGNVSHISVAWRKEF